MNAAPRLVSHIVILDAPRPGSQRRDVPRGFNQSCWLIEPGPRSWLRSRGPKRPQD